MTRWAWIVSLLLAPLVVASVIVMAAPASWADAGLASATQGRARLALAQGSLWSGQGQLVLVNPSANVAQTLQGLAVPGQLRWKVSAWALLTGKIEAWVDGDAFEQPVRLTGSVFDLQGAGLRGSAGSLRLPSVELGALGSPWNTFQPVAAVAVQWESFQAGARGFDGQVRIDLTNTGSVLSPVNPLGSYRITIRGVGATAQLELTTLQGDLQLQGNGTWTQQQGLRMTAVAQPSVSQKARLQSLLALLGRRDGDTTIIRIGA